MTDHMPSGSVSSTADGGSDTPGRRKSRVWVWAIGLLAMGFVLYWAIRRHDDRAQSAQSGQALQGPGGQAGARGLGGPVTLNMVTAKQGDLGVYLTAIGTVTPVYTSTITSQVNGLISSVHYKESEFVRRGDPLIDIDPRPYQALLEQAQGTLDKDTHIL